MTTEQYAIKGRWTGEVICTAEITVTPDMSESVNLGLAVQWAVRKGKSLSWANLRGANLSRASLREADLRGANLRGANLSRASLREADLIGANLSGASLSGANLIGADLTGANLTGANLSGASLRGADLSGADLTGANLSGASLRGADLSGANLIGADLTGANLSRAPVIPDIHKRVYEAASQPRALDMSTWHCGTAHCRAGWVVTLAGDEGKALEDKMGTPTAAALIYMASDPTLRKVPDFYCGNNKALADMARLAGVEA